MRHIPDLGFSSSNVSGPFLSWHPQASRDGTRPARSWALRITGEGSEITNLPTQGMVVDLPAIRAGWKLLPEMTPEEHQRRGNSPTRCGANSCAGPRRNALASTRRMSTECFP